MSLPWLKNVFRLAHDATLTNYVGAHAIQMETIPFRHIVIDDAFPVSFNTTVLHYLSSIRARGITDDTSKRDHFVRMKKFDASLWYFPPEEESPVRFFYSKSWRDLIASLFGIRCTTDITGCFHTHRIQSATGPIHTDYIADAFKNSTGAQMNPWYYNSARMVNTPAPDTHLSVRAISILYYLDTTLWQPGDGGETALYLNKDPSSLVKKISPINNRLALFEVTPSSHHSFIQNVRRERNCVVQWLYEDPSQSWERFRTPLNTWPT